MEGISGIIWSNLSWHKHHIDKMARHPVLLNLKNIQCWEIQHLSFGDCFNGSLFSLQNIFLLCLIRVCPECAQFVPVTSCLFLVTPCKKGIFIFFVATLEILERDDKVSPKLSFLKAEQTQFSQPFLMWQASQSICPFLWKEVFFSLFEKRKEAYGAGSRLWSLRNCFFH